VPKLMTTADLPATFRADFTNPIALRAVRASKLRLDLERCEHGRTDCPSCVIEAARQLVADAEQPAT
jgi:hypothetical protein